MKTVTFACALKAGVILAVSAQAAFAQDAAGPAVRAMPAAFDAGEPPAVPPEAQAFAAALAQETAGLDDLERSAIDGFYAARDYRPFWSEEGGAALASLRRVVTSAEAQGLPASRYDPAALDAPASGSGGAAAVPLEVAAMRVFLTFGGDLTGGIVRPLGVDAEINVKPERASAGDLLGRLSREPVDAVLRDLEPKSPDYRALMAERARLVALAAEGGWGAPVPGGPSLHVGETDPRIAVLRARLDRLGYGTDPAEVEKVLGAEPRGRDPQAARPQGGPASARATFDPALEARLKTFQRDQGLNADGVAGPRTLAALNASVGDRLAQVSVNLERLRWLNRDLGDRRIEVNIPDYSVKMLDGGKVVWSSRTVVGEANKTRTPEFSDEMTHMVVNPTWHIPDSIATRVYLPKLRTDPGVLERSGLRLFTRSGLEIDPRLVNFDQYTADSFPFRVKQNPSSENALGRVKFMFPNQFAIYLHDTPARAYFDLDERALSNGCIRLEEPLALAHVLLEGQVDDPEASFRRWLEAGTERYVTLERPVKVHLIYRTAIPRPDGSIRYREDVYGRDAEVFAALEAEGLRLPDGEQG
jgi:L,D-transpeptidase YcbB